MSRSSDSEDGCFVDMDTEDSGVTVAVHCEDLAVEMKSGGGAGEMNADCSLQPGMNGQRAMGELPEEVLEYILSFLSPYQEHKTAALVCKQWYRLIKGESVELNRTVIETLAFAAISLTSHNVYT